MKTKKILNPKKPLFWVLIILLAVIIAVGCFLAFYWLSPARSIAIIGGADGPTSVIIAQPTDNPTFEATILEINGDTALVEPSPDSDEIRSAGKITIPLSDVDQATRSSLKKGVKVLIEYDGALQETYPAGVLNLYNIYIIN